MSILIPAYIEIDGNKIMVGSVKARINKEDPVYHPLKVTSINIESVELKRMEGEQIDFN